MGHNDYTAALVCLLDHYIRIIFESLQGVFFRIGKIMVMFSTSGLEFKKITVVNLIKSLDERPFVVVMVKRRYRFEWGGFDIRCESTGNGGGSIVVFLLESRRVVRRLSLPQWTW